MDILDILLDILLKPPQSFIGLFLMFNMNNTIHCIELILKWYKKNGHFNVKCEPSLKPEILIRFMLAHDLKVMHIFLKFV